MKLHLTILSIIILFASCAPYYYPNTINVPLLNEKGDAQLNIDASTSGFNQQLAYAATENIGLMFNSNFSLGNNTNKINNVESIRNHNFFEFGAGYFTTIKNDWKFEVYGGGGFGKNQSIPIDNIFFLSDNFDIRHQRYFIQPSFAYSIENVDVAFSTRFAFLNFKDLKNNLTPSFNQFIEPALTLKFGIKEIKFLMQGGISIPTTINYETYYFNPFMVSMGLQTSFNFNKKN